MPNIHTRLRWLRDALGLSLRAMAEALRDVGYSVSHDSVWKYENGRTVPADYLGALSARFGVSVDWLLGTPPSSSPNISDLPQEVSDEIDDVVSVFGNSMVLWRKVTDDLKVAWAAFVEDQPPGHPLRDLILRSWERSRDGDVDPVPESVEYRKVLADDLERRLSLSAHLVSAAGPHLEWLSSLLRDVPHVLYLVCQDGIVLVSRSSRPSLAAQWGLEPGVDWSEEVMGTNGAALALRERRAAAVVGTEHFLEPFHRTVCLAAPIRGRDRRLLGAIDLSTPVEHGRPERLALVAYSAAMIERDLPSPES